MSFRHEDHGWERERRQARWLLLTLAALFVGWTVFVHHLGYEAGRADVLAGVRR